MTARSFIIACATACLIASANAQIPKPPSGTKSISDGGGSTDAGIRVKPPGPPIVITEVAITPQRAWKNTEGKVITGSLLAHRVEGVDIEKGDPPVIVREGHVRIYKDKKSFLYPLASLSKEDQNYIQELIFAIQEQEEKKQNQ